MLTRREVRFYSAFILSLPFCSLMASSLSYAAIEAENKLETGASQAITPTSPLPYPVADAQLGEMLYPHEADYAQQIGMELEKLIRKRDSQGQAHRDVHPKAHGCVKAQFQVLDQLPVSLSQGMFKPGHSYPAWIRFSNGSPKPDRADIKRDARGMAIKVMNVPGQKLLEDEAQASTQDFILINHPVFFANEPERYLALMKDINGGFLKKLQIPFSLGFKGSKIAFQTTRSRIANPLQARYWSMVPYQLGTGANRNAVKYSVRPCIAKQDAIPAQPDHNYLRGALKQSLNNADVCMEFLVQPRTSTALSVEDSMTEWKESDAPFYKVATLTIPQQTFDTPAQNQFCENLSFSPWHALPEHRPLGATNRMRKVIYDHISRVRHQANSVVRQEPE
ncbi:catalase family protein [Alkanindiges illinoisensis]|uniref:catalase family protein n=1 Tax=Alkanindiges illinoisensis TaxID=197183 RepID=UPI000553FA8B|nr:catalase family protein [Alkanindiges illinoisensis]